MYPIRKYKQSYSEDIPEKDQQSTSGLWRMDSQLLTEEARKREDLKAGVVRGSVRVKVPKTIIIKFYEENVPKFNYSEERMLKKCVMIIISELAKIKAAHEDNLESYIEALRFWFGSSGPDATTFAINSINELYDLFTDNTKVLTFYNMPIKEVSRYIPGMYPKSSYAGEIRQRSSRGKSKCLKSMTGEYYIEPEQDVYDNPPRFQRATDHPLSERNEKYNRDRMNRLMLKKASGFSVDIESDSEFVPLDSYIKTVLAEAIHSELDIHDVIPTGKSEKHIGEWVGGGSRRDCIKLAERNPDIVTFNAYNLLYFILDFDTSLTPDFC